MFSSTKPIVASLLSAILLLAPTPSLAQRISADGAAQTLDFLSEQYFTDVYFKYSPTAATQIGFHEYDTQLEDYSAATLLKEVAALHTWEKKIAAIPPDALDAPQAADREI